MQTETIEEKLHVIGRGQARRWLAREVLHRLVVQRLPQVVRRQLVAELRGAGLDDVADALEALEEAVAAALERIGRTEN